jgi:hypothetical protein
LLIIRLHGALLPLSSSSLPRTSSGRRDDTGKIYFDEVHYVPAARQMLEPVMPAPMLNPMHPSLAR